jgi:hypothetical protein
MAPPAFLRRLGRTDDLGFAMRLITRDLADAAHLCDTLGVVPSRGRWS